MTRRNSSWLTSALITIALVVYTQLTTPSRNPISSGAESTFAWLIPTASKEPIAHPTPAATSKTLQGIESCKKVPPRASADKIFADPSVKDESL
ncbi:hypothetical protein C7B61_09580 [filamentous cyanobacterium CCP1]|nr:hypothetical protein C7B76_02180 [filamentous cyanobacterium CCP2]PSB66782.1 hypothetical protein C7B61_09580 [filamentous cyanobacterium CCP1]